MLKILQLVFNSTSIMKFQVLKLNFEMAEEREIKLPISVGSSKKQESSRKISISALLTRPKPLTCGSQQTVENSERDGNTRPPNLPPEKSVCRSGQFSSVAQSCPTLCDPMNHSTPDLPVHHQLPEFTQTHVHRVSDAIQPSHPPSSPPREWQHG